MCFYLIPKILNFKGSAINIKWGLLKGFDFFSSFKKKEVFFKELKIS